MKSIVIIKREKSSLWMLFLFGFYFCAGVLQAQDGKLTLSNEVGASGTQVCAEVTVEGFTDLDGFSMVINSAPTTNMTTFAEITNINPLLNTVDVTDLTVFGVGIEWSIPPPSMLSLPDGDVLFEICYNVVGNPGETIDLIFVPGLVIGTFFFKSNGDDCILETMNGSITIPDAPPPIVITEDNIAADDCFAEDNGSVEITVTGGVPPYTFAWSNLTNNEDLVDVAAGTYMLTITDSSPEQVQEIVTFDVPDLTEAPIADAGTNNLLTCNDNIISIGGDNTTLGTDFEYLWTSPGATFVSGQMDPIAEIDQPGTYTLLVTNTLTNCDAESIVVVTEDKDPPNVDAGMDVTAGCDLPVTLTVTNDQGLQNLSVLWTLPEGSGTLNSDLFSIEGAVVGLYIVELTNLDNGCVSTDEVNVLPPVLPSIGLVDDPTPLNCDQPTVDLSVNTEDGNEIVWTTIDGEIQGPANELSVTIISEGLYTPQVTDPNTGCTSTIDVQVVGNTDEPTVNAGNDVTFTCNDPIVNLMGSTDAMTTEWTDANGNFISSDLSIDVNRVGSYFFNATNEFGCLRSDEVLVVADTVSPIANAGIDLEVACIEGDGLSLDGSGSDMGSEFTYMWSTSNGTLVSDFMSLSPIISTVGNYDLVVTNTQNGCTSISSVMISLQADLPLADAGADFSTCENSATIMGNLDTTISGEWTTTSSASIENVISASTTANNLAAGSNAFVWTLSTDICADYSRDTVFVTFENTPLANDDDRSIPLDEDIISFSVLDNDDTSNNDGVTIAFQTMDPNFMDLSDGVFSYTFPTDTSNTFSFNYIVCSEVCPDLCDEAEVIVRRLEPSLEPVELDGLPNVITPNGDGLNDALIFDIMLTNPQDFPNPELVVFNRWGDVVYRQQPYDNNWQGTNQTGGDLPEGTYYFINRLNLENTDILTGDITIIRD
jgi:gliding motility-associated-like protein